MGNNTLRVFNDSAKYKGSYTLRNTDIKVQEILDLLARGYTQEQLRDIYHPNLREKDFDVCFAIAAHHVKGHQLYKQNNVGSKRAFVLLDENQPYSVIPHIVNETSKIGHVSFFGFAQKSDQSIFDFMQKSGVDSILTNDDDFINIVRLAVMRRIFESKSFDVDVSDLPLIGFMVENNHKEARLEETLKKYLPDITDQATDSNRKHLWVNVDRNGICYGDTPKGIFHGFIRESIKDAAFLYPCFDTHLIDVRRLNDLCHKYEFDGFQLKSYRARTYRKMYRRQHGRSWKMPSRKSKLVA